MQCNATDINPTHSHADGKRTDNSTDEWKAELKKRIGLQTSCYPWVVLLDNTSLPATVQLDFHLSATGHNGAKQKLSGEVRNEDQTKRSRSRSVEIVEKSTLFMYL